VLVWARVSRKKGLTLAAVIGVLILSATIQLSYVHASPPVAQIITVNHPSQVLTGTTFRVTIVVDYSDKVGVDAGIWSADTGTVIQSISIALHDTGPTVFAFNLTAPSETTEWRLLALTRIWWLNAWYQDPIEGSRAFTVSVSKDATLTVASSGPALQISLDNSTYQVTACAGIAISTAPGLHLLYSQQVITSGRGERFVFVGWSDGVNSNPRSIVVGGSVNLTALYRKEYYLSVNSELGLTAGHGWYPAGANPSFAVMPFAGRQNWLGVLSRSYRFDGWSGDSNSSDALASITMNGPKNVQARWSYSGSAIDSSVLIFCTLILGSLVLFIRGVRRFLAARASPVPRGITKNLPRWTLVVMALALVLIQVPSAQAQLPAQAGRSIVRIGDASWYYWNNTSSDTCMIWLGGGTTNEQEVGHYSYMINPLEFESFGTINFLQHLATDYCLIALQKGAYEYLSPDSNRTIFQEPYTMDSRIISDIHDWVIKQGYARTFLVGYSTGAQVAAMETTIRAPEEWVSPDGLVLITPRLSDIVSKNAYRIRASLLVLYGGSIETPAYVSTGHEFFMKAPGDGLYNSSYFHKQFRVIERMGHEVWTVYETGVYDTQAERILVSFVNNVKALQFSSTEVEMISRLAINASAPAKNGLNLTSVTAPAELFTTMIMRIRAVISYNGNAPLTALVAFNPQTGIIEDSQQFSAIGAGTRVLLLTFLPRTNSTNLTLAVIVLTRAGGLWTLTSGPVMTSTEVRHTVQVTLRSTVPGTSLLFDGTVFRIPTSGTVSLQAELGPHTVGVQPVSSASSGTRIIFAGWEDGNSDASTVVNLDNDTIILATYRLQYFVNVTSPYGTPAGSGWYDENSTMVASVEPPLYNGTSSVIFSQWEGGNNSTELRVIVSVQSTTFVSAEWTPSPVLAGMNTGLVMVGAFFFVLTVLWNLVPIPRKPMHEAQYR
jgi:hypothetical protein